MIRKTFVIKNTAGILVESAGFLCREAEQFGSHITFEHKGSVANAKSFLDILGAGLRCGDQVTFVCDGPDEEAAIRRMEELVETGFGE